MIFLSYSWKDQAAAHSLDAILRGRGLDVWIDFRDLDLRLDIANQLEAAIRRCSLFLAFQPRKRRSTPWTMAELLMAIEHGRPIVQLSNGLVAPGQLAMMSTLGRCGNGRQDGRTRSRHNNREVGQVQLPVKASAAIRFQLHG